MERMGDENTGLVRRGPEEDVLEDVLADMGVERGDGVVEDLDVRSDVDGAANVDTLLLTTGE